MSRATACFSMYSDMSMRTIACSSSNRNSASARAVSVLPTPVGPRKMNEPIGRLGSCSPARERRTAFGHGLHRLVLPDHALRQLLVELRETLALALEHPRHRNAGPPRDDFGDVLGADFLLEELRAPVRGWRACASASLHLRARAAECVP